MRTVEIFSDAALGPEGKRGHQGLIAAYGGAPVQWDSRLQPFCVLSTTESELLGYCDGLVLGESISSIVSILENDAELDRLLYGDSMSGLKLLEAPDGPWRTRHLRLRSHVLRERLRWGLWKARHLRGAELAADLLTKPVTSALTWEKFFNFMLLTHGSSEDDRKVDASKGVNSISGFAGGMSAKKLTGAVAVAGGVVGLAYWNPTTKVGQLAKAVAVTALAAHLAITCTPQGGEKEKPKRDENKKGVRENEPTPPRGVQENELTSPSAREDEPALESHARGYEPAWGEITHLSPSGSRRPRLCAMRGSPTFGPMPWTAPEFNQPPRAANEDIWIQITGGWVVRVHRSLRTNRFHPVHRSCPVQTQDLEARRISVIWWSGPRGWERSVQEDQWGSGQIAPWPPVIGQWRGWTFFRLSESNQMGQNSSGRPRLLPDTIEWRPSDDAQNAAWNMPRQYGRPGTKGGCLEAKSKPTSMETEFGPSIVDARVQSSFMEAYIQSTFLTSAEFYGLFIDEKSWRASFVELWDYLHNNLPETGESAGGRSEYDEAVEESEAGSDDFSLVTEQVVAALCVKIQHPPSNYVRHAVWAVFGSWLLVTLLAALVFFPKEYHPLLQHAAWHLEGIDFVWIAWLMTDRITALTDRPSYTLSNSGTIIRTAAICFHLRIVTETFLGIKNVSIAIQMVFAATFLMLWMFLCVRIAFCLARSFWLLRKELHVVQGAPEAEARWALDVVRLEILACALITFSCTTLWWLPYKVLSWAEDQQVADQVLLIPVVVAHRFNHLIKATSVAALSGLLWPCHTSGSEKTFDIDKLDRAPTMSIRLSDPDLWTDKVHELANRGVTLTSLLNFWRKLEQVMPSFDPQVSTTSDVVRLAIIPLSHDPSTGEGHALASLWSQGEPVRAQCMVTHNWSNLFHHLVAGIFADALEKEYYAGVAEMLLHPDGCQQLEDSIQARNISSKSYWVCAFSVNQHACICDNFGRAPPEGTPEFEAHDAMMRHLNRKQDGFSHLVVADTAFDVFTRAWCIAEIVESGRSRIHQQIKLYSEATLDSNYQRLSSIDVRCCKASRPEDREMILQSITDIKQFNSDLRWRIFGTEGLLSKWLDGPSRAKLVGRVLRRAGTFGGHLSSGSTLDPMDSV
eukprot:s4008_g3.t1